MLSSILVLTTFGIALAYDPSYTRLDGPTQVEPTIDGMWTSPDEWTDGEQTWIGTSEVHVEIFDRVERLLVVRQGNANCLKKVVHHLVPVAPRQGQSLRLHQWKGIFLNEVLWLRVYNLL